MNDVLPFNVPQGATYEIRAEKDGQVAGRQFTAGTNAQAMVVISLKDSTLPPPPAVAIQTEAYAKAQRERATPPSPSP